MKVKIKTGNGTLIDADWTIEDDVMIVSPKKAKKSFPILREILENIWLRQERIFPKKICKNFMRF